MFCGYDITITIVTADAAMQLSQQQTAVYQLCERMFDALMQWARTKDISHLLAVQKTLRYAQNSNGDT